jgi:single-strand DNA-binding protein
MNLNKVFLIGRLTKDPDVRSTPSGQTVATISMATNRAWTSQSGQKQDATEYHTIIAWGRLAEICSQYLKRGGLAMFEGRLQTSSWDDKTTGAKRYKTEIVAESMQLGPRPASTGQGGYSGQQSGGYSAPVADIKRSAPAAAPVSSIPVVDADIPIIDENELTRQGVEEGEVSIKDSDLPF